MDDGLALQIETGWPIPTLWPNARPHHMALYRAKAAATKEAYWATCIVKPRGYKHDGSRLKLTIEAHPAVDRGRDDDNLIAACKAARDGIAAALKMDDGLFDLQPVIWAEKHERGRLTFIVEPGA